jgi:hypothetical protein
MVGELVHRGWQHWKSKVLCWRQEHAEEIWHKRQSSLLKVTSSLADGSQAVAGLCEAAANVKSTDALSDPLGDYEKKTGKITPQLFSAQAGPGFPERYPRRSIPSFSVLSLSTENCAAHLPGSTR